MSKEIEQLKISLQQDQDYVVRLRRWFHAHPELSAKEEQTAKKIEQELHALGLQTQRTAKTGVISEIKGTRPGHKTIVLRADIDALPMNEASQVSYASQNPGVMHACGHDAHTACLLQAARLLCANKDLFGGTIRLIFQPGEEIGYGANRIIAEGHLQDADRTFGLHVASSIPSGSVVLAKGPNNAAVDQFKILIHGKSAHITSPEKGADATYAASRIICRFHELEQEHSSKDQPLLIGIGRAASGTAYNIISDYAEIEGTLRTYDHRQRAEILALLEQEAEKIAREFGASAQLINRDNTSPLINDETSTNEAIQTAEEIYGSSIIKERRPDLSGDDFAEFIKAVPGVYAYIGTATPDQPNTLSAQHDTHFDIDEDALPDACLLYAGYAVQYLNGQNAC